MRTKTPSTYLSGWILNLGVVPLLLFSAFLFLPAFVFLRLLLFSVTRVLETMSILLNQQALKGHFAISKPKVISGYERSVKAILTCLCTFLLCSTSFTAIHENRHLQVGEHDELLLPKMTSFTVSDGESLGYKERPKRKSLLLKGKAPGKSQVVIWNNDGTKKTYNIYVLDNKRDLGLQNLKQKLSVEGVTLEIGKHFIELTGQIESLELYLYLKNVIQDHKDLIVNRLTISKTLSDKIFARVYQKFFREYVDHISCNVQEFDLICQHRPDKSITEKLTTRLTNELGVKFVKLKNESLMQNYKVRLKLFQMEQMDGKQINLGLSQLNTKLRDLFKRGVSSIVENNQLLLKENNIQVSSLAEPEAIVQSGQEVSLDIGSDIPYTVTTVQGSAQTQWKFAGLKINIKIEKRGNALKVRYQTSFTRPSADQIISGNRESSTVTLPLDTPVDIFQVSFQTQGQQKQNIPVLGDIPILGQIFTSTGSQSNYKNITGVIQIEKHQP